MGNFSKFFTILFFLLIAFVAILGYDKEKGIFRKETLKDVVAKSLEGAKGDYSIVIQNLKTGEYYALNKDKVYEPASLYKLWVMATVYQEIKNGRLKETDILSASIPQLNKEFEITDPELTTGGIEKTVSEALRQMIVISHNYAALLLAKEVGNSKISKFLEDYGFNNSSLSLISETEVPKTTPGDIALFYEKLYKGEIVGPGYSKKMIEILLKQELNDRIPKYLPKDARVAHKTGEINFYKHDAGIVFSPKTDYLIVLMSESEFPAGAAERMANLSKTVYDYFQY
jgi:beta-lactamase class A